MSLNIIIYTQLTVYATEMYAFSGMEYGSYMSSL